MSESKSEPKKKLTVTFVRPVFIYGKQIDRAEEGAPNGLSVAHNASGVVLKLGTDEVFVPWSSVAQMTTKALLS
jgi:hypothetical protein